MIPDPEKFSCILLGREANGLEKPLILSLRRNSNFHALKTFLCGLINRKQSEYKYRFYGIEEGIYYATRFMLEQHIQKDN